MFLKNCQFIYNFFLTVTFDFRLQLAIPKTDSGSFDKCSMYDVDFIAEIKKGVHVGNTSWPRRKCLNGYEYDHSEIPFTTIATEVIFDFFSEIQQRLERF